MELLGNLPVTALVVGLMILPGYVYGLVKGKFVPEDIPKETHLLRYILRTAVIYAVCAPMWATGHWHAVSNMLVLLSGEPDINGIEVTSANVFLVYVMMVGFPALFGLLMGIIGRYSPVDRFLKRLPPVRTIGAGQAWDKAFAQQWNKDVVVIVTLKSRQMIAGVFGGESLASPEGGYRDLYLQRELTVDPDTGSLMDIAGSRGCLILGREIVNVRFIEQDNPNEGANPDRKAVQEAQPQGE